jgi:hypothetical protein
MQRFAAMRKRFTCAESNLATKKKNRKFMRKRRQPSGVATANGFDEFGGADVQWGNKRQRGHTHGRGREHSENWQQIGNDDRVSCFASTAFREQQFDLPMFSSSHAHSNGNVGQYSRLRGQDDRRRKQNVEQASRKNTSHGQVKRGAGTSRGLSGAPDKHIGISRPLPLSSNFDSMDDDDDDDDDNDAREHNNIDNNDNGIQRRQRDHVRRRDRGRRNGNRQMNFDDDDDDDDVFGQRQSRQPFGVGLFDDDDEHSSRSNGAFEDNDFASDDIDLSQNGDVLSDDGGGGRQRRNTV